MSQDWLGPAIHASVCAVLIFFVVAGVFRRRRDARPEAQVYRMLHRPGTLFIALAGGGLFFGFALLSNLLRDDSATIWTTLIFFGFGLVSMMMAADYFVARHDLTDEGIHYGRLGRPRRSMAWPEVAQLRYSPSMKWFKLVSRTGEVARVSAMLVGLPEFARLALAHVPAHAIDAKTLIILGDTADGLPPKVWA